MTGLFYEIDDQIFARFPGYVRGVVLAYDVRNGPSPEDLVAPLRAAEAFVREQLDPAAIAEHPRIRSWREAFRAFDAKPSEYRSSIEAMARRALRGDPLPSINALVDIGNMVSLQSLLPAGAHAIDVVEQDLALRPAAGIEDFVALGSDVVEHPEPGEIIFAEGNTVLTRRWTWRQGTHTLALPNTRAVEYNVDGLPPVTPQEVAEACQTVAGLVERFCGGRVYIQTLSPIQPRIPISE